MQLSFSAPTEVLEIITAIERPEDVRFSPDGLHLAIADTTRQVIVILAIERRTDANGLSVHLASGRCLPSPKLLYPHGLDFIDNHTLAVANREGDVCVFAIPEAGTSSELILLNSIPTSTRDDLGPGSVAAIKRTVTTCELLVCRTFGNRVTRHLLARDNGFSVVGESPHLEKWLHVPDGIHGSLSKHWLAVTSHHTQSSLIYRYDDSLGPNCDPVAVLRGCHYPHGIRFSSDDRYVVVSDAGAPYLHLYHQPDGQWQGIYDPILSLRVMNEALFREGSAGNPQEGGPKGVDIDQHGQLLVSVCAKQTLAFFDFTRLKSHTRDQGALAVPGSPASSAERVHLELEKHECTARYRIAAVSREQQAAQYHQIAVKAEHRLADQAAVNEQLRTQVEQLSQHISALNARTTAAETFAAELVQSRSWRLTAPLRWLKQDRAVTHE